MTYTCIISLLEQNKPQPWYWPSVGGNKDSCHAVVMQKRPRCLAPRSWTIAETEHGMATSLEVPSAPQKQELETPSAMDKQNEISHTQESLKSWLHKLQARWCSFLMCAGALGQVLNTRALCQQSAMTCKEEPLGLTDISCRQNNGKSDTAFNSLSTEEYVSYLF